MIYSFFSIFLLFVSSSIIAQNKIDYATITGTITDYKAEVIVGQVILFENTSSKKVFKATSNNKGIFKSKLPCNANYLIKIKGFNDAKDYTELPIPALEPNQKSASFEIDIKYEPSKKFTLNNVYFDFGKATLTRTSYKELNKLVSYLSQRKDEIIEIGGHTDDIGEPNDNLMLSKKRANAIVKYLIKKGIETNRLKAVGYGENNPIASNQTNEGRKLNRRTEVKVISKIK